MLMDSVDQTGGQSMARRKNTETVAPKRRGRPSKASAVTTAEAPAEATEEEATPNLRNIKIGPEQFAALKNELQMSNKEVAEAIGRTLARVSELTHSKGASAAIYESFETAVRAWREANPIQNS
jgi:hypothetical protein